jgi:hypothetical protein
VSTERTAPSGEQTEDFFMTPPDAEGVKGWRGNANASRRASLASKMLTQSLAVMPQTPPANEEMPPPAVPPPAQSGASGSRSSSRIAEREGADASRVSRRAERAAAAAERGKSVAPTSAVPVVLDTLKDCTIFVDVRTDDGDDAGGLFKEMLQGLGARVRCFLFLCSPLL